MSVGLKAKRSAIKSHGGKFNLAKSIVSRLPDHDIWIEPFFGSGVITLNKPRAAIEYANDLDPALINFWTVLRDQTPSFCGMVADLEYDADQFAYSFERWREPRGKSEAHRLHWAVHYFVVNRMSRGGMMRDFAVPGAGEARLRGGLPDNVNAWETIKAELPAIAERMRHVILANQPAEKLILEYRDVPNCVMVLDPPYLPDTRMTKDAYRFEMNGRDHMHLLDAIRMSKATFFLCGYPSPLYTEYLPGWHCVETVVANSSGQSKTKESRTECLWSNKPFAVRIPTDDVEEAA